jgi:hypothetical protein
MDVKDAGRLNGARGRRRLSLEEVRESGLPALFFDYGDALLYLDGQLFNARDWVASDLASTPPPPLPAQILEAGVGIEYGWQHAADCTCRFCVPLGAEEESAA